MQEQVMKFDPATGEQKPYPSHAEQWRRWNGLDCAWLFDPWTGTRRNALDVGSDTVGRLIVPAGTLGRDIGVAGQLQNAANTQAQASCVAASREAPCSAHDHKGD